MLYLPVVLVIKFAIVLLLTMVFGFGLRAALLSALLLMPFDEIGYVVFASAGHTACSRSVLRDGPRA